MTVPIYVYENAIKNFELGLIDWDSHAIKCGLLTAYTPSESHETWTAVKAAGTEHSAANGYATGGATLAGKTNVCSGGITTLGCSTIVWTATGTLTARYAVLYDSVTDNVIAYIPLNGGSDFSASDADLTIADPNGLFSIDVSP